MADLFDNFWASGIRKMNKKKARSSFAKVIKSQDDPDAFTDQLIFDVQKRLKGNQLGFKEMHPTTYLNGERWEDELPHNDTCDALDRLVDRSWADGMVEEKLISTSN